MSPRRVLPEDVGPELIARDCTVGRLLDGKAPFRWDPLPHSPSADRGRLDTQKGGQLFLASDDLDDTVNGLCAHGCRFSHELIPNVKPMAKLFVLARS